MREFKHNKAYAIIKARHMTTAMKNRCATYDLHRAPNFLKTRVYLVKLTTEILEKEHLFDEYVWYDKDEIAEELKKGYKKESN